MSCLVGKDGKIERVESWRLVHCCCTWIPYRLHHSLCVAKKCREGMDIVVAFSVDYPSIL